MSGGFRSLLSKANYNTGEYQIIAAGPRSEAFKKFCTALAAKNSNEEVLLLVDSEQFCAPSKNKWLFLAERQNDQWKKTGPATEHNVFLMVQVMETWLASDQDTLRKFFGHKLNLKALPQASDFENLHKMDIYRKLKLATRNTQKGPYDKASHSFHILSMVSPEKVMQLPHGRDFFDNLNDLLR